VEMFGAGLGAIHDGVAAVEAERVFQIVEPLAGRLVARIDDPALRLQQRRRAEIALGIPPIARARGRAAGAQDAFVEAVELGPVLVALPPFLLRRRRHRLHPRRSPASSLPPAATARSRRAGRRNWSGPAPGLSLPHSAAADRRAPRL